MALENDIQTLTAAIERLADALQQATGGVKPAAFAFEVVDNTTEVKTEVAKPKVGPKPKQETTTPVVVESVVEIQQDQDQEITFDSLKVLFLDGCDKDLDATLAALKAYDAQKLSEVDKTQYAKLYADLTKIVGV